jgi:hypothetical protein
VTASTGVVTAMVLARVRRVSVRRLIGIGKHPIATEIHGRIRHGCYRQGSQQTKRKNNTHAHILLPNDFHMDTNARVRPAPTSIAKSPVTKRKRMQRMWWRRDNGLVAA